MNQSHYHDPFQSNQNVGNFLNPTRSCIRLYNPQGVFAANRVKQQQMNRKSAEVEAQAEAEIDSAKADFAKEAARVRKQNFQIDYN